MIQRPFGGEYHNGDIGMEFENHNNNEGSSSKVESAEKRDSVASLHGNDYKKLSNQPI